jgi:hypothetical protein
MRVIFNHLFTLSLAKIKPKEYVLRVAGDDAVLWVEREKAPALEHAIRRCFGRNKEDNTLGLGQILDWSRNEKLRFEFCSKILVPNPSNPIESQLVRKPESVLYKGHRYYGQQKELKEDPKKYSFLWASSLKGETKGPIYRQLAEIRFIMAEGREADPKLDIKKHNIICKNDYNPKLEESFLTEFAFWHGCTYGQIEKFSKFLDDTIMFHDKGISKIKAGLILPDPKTMTNW